jgi:mannose-6-phosphate isomerase-like protein (cupin superfamily)
MATQQAPAPASLTALGQPRWFFGMLAEVKASAADTAGQYTLLEITAPPGLEAPLHVHYTEDEGFYILESSVTIVTGDETVELTRGRHAFGPRDVPHRFTVGPGGARML